MDDKHSKIEYHEFEDDDINNSLYKSVEEEDEKQDSRIIKVVHLDL